MSSKAGDDLGVDDLQGRRMRIETKLAIIAELKRARQKFPKFHSAHEGFAVLNEEVDEMWDAVRKDCLSGAQREAIQVAAMAIRFIEDL